MTNVPFDISPDLLEDFCRAFAYPTVIPNPADPTTDLLNPETKEAFFIRRTQGVVAEILTNYRRQQVREQVEPVSFV